MQDAANKSSIVLLKEKDAAELAELEASCFSTAWTREQYAAILRGVEQALGNPDQAHAGPPPFLVWGFRAPDGALAGYVSLGLHRAVKELEIYNIAVHASRRAQGYGKRLLSWVIQEFRRIGYEKILLEVRTGNAPALALYASAGFVECGRRKKYYTDTGEDALVLSRDLTGTDFSSSEDHDYATAYGSQLENV